MHKTEANGEPKREERLQVGSPESWCLVEIRERLKGAQESLRTERWARGPKSEIWRKDTQEGFAQLQARVEDSCLDMGTLEGMDFNFYYLTQGQSYYSKSPQHPKQAGSSGLPIWEREQLWKQLAQSQTRGTALLYYIRRRWTWNPSESHMRAHLEQNNE